MKKLAIVTSAAFLMFTAVLNAQTDSTKPATDPATQPATTEKPASKDKYNNWSADTYKMQPLLSRNSQRAVQAADQSNSSSIGW